MILSDVLIFLEGYNERMINEWRRTRQVAYTIAAANRNPKKSFPSIYKYMPLPGDKATAAKKTSDLKRRYEEIKQHYIKLGII